MDLLVDIGNSRVKWGHNDNRMEPGLPVIHQNSDFEARLFSIWRALPKSPQRMAISCVASKVVLDQVKTIALDLWPSMSIIQAHSVAEAYGVRNAYEFPEKLGVDRWLCLIAARHYWSEPVCIVDCGTAITVDAMDRNGCHLGGLICPGLTLMKTSLSKGTADLRLSVPQSGLPHLARGTSDAIDNGALYAAIGLIRSVMADLDKPVKLVLTGGDASNIALHLGDASCVVPDLVLNGLSLILAE